MTDPLERRVRITKTGLFEMIPVLTPPPFAEESRAINFAEDCCRARNFALQQIMQIQPSYRSYRKIRYEDWRVGDVTPLFVEYFDGQPKLEFEAVYAEWTKGFLKELSDAGFTQGDAYMSTKLQRYWTFKDSLLVTLILHNDPNTVMFARMRGIRILRLNELIAESKFEIAAL